MPKNAVRKPILRVVRIALLVFAGCGALRQARAQEHPREIHVLAASDLQPVLPALSAAFAQATGIHVVPSFASSSTLATQIVNGAPGDLFLSADFSFAERVVAAGLAEEKAPVPYARGTLVLFALKSSPFQPLNQNTLRNPKIQSLAVADPTHAPYGLAAEQALRAMKLFDPLKPHLVTAENIAQTAQFVESGNAQLGLISLTLADSPHLREIGTYIRMPQLYFPLGQCGVVLKNSPHREDAQAFLTWLTSRPVQQMLPKYGLDPVQ
jgi:molybdate transport system substrate-binding protein